MRQRITDRDYEMLRTIGRLRFCRTVNLASLYPSIDVVRRRLKVMREQGLIESKKLGEKAVVGREGYWRLTRDGLRVFNQMYGKEAKKDEWLLKVRRAKVSNHEHQEALCPLYVDIICPPDEGEWSKRVSERAKSFIWRGDYEVKLPLSKRGRGKHVVPDATIETSDKHTVFVELDRSNKTHKRLREQFGQYVRYYSLNGYPTDRVCVVFVFESSQRAKNVAKALVTSARGFPYVCLSRADAASWFRRRLLDEATDVSSSYYELERQRDELQSKCEELTSLLEQRRYTAELDAAIADDHEEELSDQHARWELHAAALRQEAAQLSSENEALRTKLSAAAGENRRLWSQLKAHEMGPAKEEHSAKPGFLRGLFTNPN